MEPYFLRQTKGNRPPAASGPEAPAAARSPCHMAAGPTGWRGWRAQGAASRIGELGGGGRSAIEEEGPFPAIPIADAPRCSLGRRPKRGCLGQKIARVVTFSRAGNALPYEHDPAGGAFFPLPRAGNTGLCHVPTRNLLIKR